jgi:hypothetical protein
MSGQETSQIVEKQYYIKKRERSLIKVIHR